jgi:hypothetical protein
MCNVCYCIVLFLYSTVLHCCTLPPSINPVELIIIIIIIECVSVALGVQHSKRMRRIILLSVACPALQYFSKSSHKRYDFRKKLLNIKCVFWFSPQLLSEKLLILRRTERNVIKDVHWFHGNYPLFSSDFNDSLNFLDRFSSKDQMSNFMKILSVEAEFFHADGRTIVALRNFAFAP